MIVLHQEIAVIVGKYRDKDCVSAPSLGWLACMSPRSVGVGSSIALTLISSSSVELAGMPSRATSPAVNSDPFSLDFSCLCPEPVLVKVILFGLLKMAQKGVYY